LLGNDFTEKIFVQPPNEWQGPLTSSTGVHFVRVISRQAEQPLALEAIRPMLESHWVNEQQGDAVAREVDKLKADYRIVLPDGATTRKDGK
jgi:parvulin-like peptidyl-prolyl isomerase